MTQTVKVEIVGFKDAECSPFPCTEERTCGLSDCHPTGKLTAAFDALQKTLVQRYGSRVTVGLTLLDEGTPPHIRAIVEAHHPALPMVIVNGRVTPVGRIALDRIIKEIEKDL